MLSGAEGRVEMRASEWALVAALAVALAPALAALASIWSSVDYYSHGFLVPFVAWWIARPRLGRAAVVGGTRYAPGLLVLVGALALYLLGLAGSAVPPQGLAIVVAVAGLVLYLRGPHALRALTFPIVFLVFMVPLPDAWIAPRIVDLQLVVSAAAVDLLHAFGFTVARNGNVLMLAGGEELFVDEACSGITSIITLMPLGVVLAYYTGRGLWRRALLVAAVIPIAMFWNLVRVVVTVLAADAYGAEVATGSVLHEFAGLLTFIAACLVLIGVGSLLGGRYRTPRAGPGRLG